MSGTNIGIDDLADAELIGEGGFASVYAATDRRLHRRVAVKVMRKNLTASAQRKFARECVVMGRLSKHPNVATVYSSGYTDDGLPYLVMELLAGGSLAEAVKRSGPLPWRDAVRYLIPVAEALDAAHRAGIVHRDVKPDNILLDDGVPHLTDFGIADLQWVDANTTSEVVASWHHSPPETFEDERDERSDLYSLASTLFTLIVGHGPFYDPDHRTILSLIHRVASDPPPELPTELGPPQLNRFIAWAMAKNPDHRPQTAVEVADELRQLADLSEVDVDPTKISRPQEHSADAAGRDVAVRAEDGAGSRQPQPSGGHRSRMPVVVALSVLAVVGAVLVVGAMAYFGRSPTEDVSAPPAAPVTGAEPATPVGEANNPYPLGQSVNLFYDDATSASERQWRIEILDSLADDTGATAIVPPEANLRLVTASLRVTYRGGAEPGPMSQIQIWAGDAAGRRFEPVADGCDATTEPFDVDAELSIGEAVEGEFCWWVPTDAQDSVLVAVAATPADGQLYLATQ